MKKRNLLTKLRKWITRTLNDTNNFAYFSLSLLFIGLSFFSLGFETTEKPFTIISSLGCGGIASVVVAYLIEKSNNRIIKRRNKTAINQLLYNFDAYVISECQRALNHCAKHQDFDIEKDYTIAEIVAMLEKEKSSAVYFKGFSDTIEQGLNGVTEVTLLNFDQSEFGSRLYDLFLALRTTVQTISKVSDMDNSDEIVKIMVIDCLQFINDINIARDKNITYHILDSDKDYIKSFRAAVKRNQKENIQ